MRKHTRRRHYALKNPLVEAMAGASFMPPCVEIELCTNEQRALGALAEGTGDQQDLVDLVDLCNIGETMALDGVGPEGLDSLRRGHAALVAALERQQEEGGGYRVTAEEHQVLRDAYEYHRMQRTGVPYGVYRQAFTKTLRRIRSGVFGTVVVL